MPSMRPRFMTTGVRRHREAVHPDGAAILVDAKTGLLYHGWDESRKQRWADPTTGRSPNFWDRAMGWYAMALVDTLDHFPHNHPQRAELIAILNRLARAVTRYQDRPPDSGTRCRKGNGERETISRLCRPHVCLRPGKGSSQWLPCQYLFTVARKDTSNSRAVH